MSRNPVTYIDYTCLVDNEQLEIFLNFSKRIVMAIEIVIQESLRVEHSCDKAHLPTCACVEEVEAGISSW